MTVLSCKFLQAKLDLLFCHAKKDRFFTMLLYHMCIKCIIDQFRVFSTFKFRRCKSKTKCCIGLLFSLKRWFDCTSAK